MSDNLKQLEENIGSVITDANGPNSIEPSDDANLRYQGLQKAGKYIGAPFRARKSPENGIVPTGVLFFNNKPLNTTTDFTITVSKRTADLNDVGLWLKSMKPGSMIHFKDYAGRSAFFTYKSHVEDQDSDENDIYDITVSGLAENPNYSYQDDDDEISMLEFIFDNKNYHPYGQLTIYQSEANAQAGTTELSNGDVGVGVLENGIFMFYGEYNGGTPITSFSSWENVDFRDPNDN